MQLSIKMSPLSKWSAVINKISSEKCYFLHVNIMWTMPPFLFDNKEYTYTMTIG
jgi:hypothetical protein